MNAGYTPDVQRAVDTAERLSDGAVTTEEILAGLLSVKDCYARAIIVRLGVNPGSLIGEKAAPEQAGTANRVFAAASECALGNGKRLFDSQHLLYALCASDCAASSILGRFGITADKLYPIILSIDSAPLPLRSAEIAPTKQKKRRMSLKELTSALKERIIGQDEAVLKIARALIRAEAGLSDSKRPQGVLLFAGLSGVGKTELAKSVADILYGGSLLRVDCGEFTDKQSLSRLTGAAPGYVGYEDGGELSEALISNPRMVVLFDEIEKAHPDLHKLLLGVTEDGKLTDAKGRTLDFSETLIVMTTNAGAEAKKRVGFDGGGEDGAEVLKAYFRPEFLGRIDEIVVFKPLGLEELKKITALRLAELGAKLKNIGIELEYSEEFLAHCARLALESEGNAREVRRIVRRLAEDSAAEAITDADNKGLKKILLDFANGGERVEIK